MKNFERGHWIIILFNLAYLIGFTVYYVSIKNYEFLGYIAVLASLFSLILLTVHKSKFDYLILWGLSIWGLLHMSGGGVIVNGAVLYNLKIIYLFNIGDTYIFKFDQFVHMFGFFVTALVAFHVLKGQIKGKPRWSIVYILAALVSMGLGAVNEIAELIATVSFSGVNVGGYYNNALDLVFNALGAFLAIFVMRKKR
jgi:hypothetical protein